MRFTGIGAARLIALGLSICAGLWPAALSAKEHRCFAFRGYYLDPEVTIEDCTAIIRRGGDEAALAYSYRARAYQTLEAYGRALSDFEAALRLEREAVRRAAIHSLRGKLYRDRRDLETALAEYDRAIALDPKAQLHEGFVLRAELWELRGDYARALADYNSEIKVAQETGRPVRSQGRLLRGRANYYVGNFAAAALDFQSVFGDRIAFDKHHAALWLFLTRRRLGQEGAPELEAAIGQASGLNVDYYRVAHLLLGRISPADVQPANCQNKFWIGQHHLLRSEKALAIEAFRAVTTLCGVENFYHRDARGELARMQN